MSPNINQNKYAMLKPKENTHVAKQTCFNFKNKLKSKLKIYEELIFNKSSTTKINSKFI